MKRVLSRWGRFVTTTLSRTLSHTSRFTSGLRQTKRRDRRESLLLESLKTVTAERDNLLVECERLTQEYDRLTQECDRLRRDGQASIQDAQYAEYVETENQRLQQEKDRLQQDYDQLLAEHNELQFDALNQEERILALEEQVAALVVQVEAVHASPIDAVAELDVAEPNLDLSPYRVALVGGHPSTRQGVIQALTADYGLRVKNCVEIPPFTEESTNSNRVRARISRCDLVVIITGYMGHGLTRIVQDLNSAGALAGEILMLDCRGKSGVVREIVSYFQRELNGRSPQQT
jgi:hypothetical protein